MKQPTSTMVTACELPEPEPCCNDVFAVPSSCNKLSEDLPLWADKEVSIAQEEVPDSGDTSDQALAKQPEPEPDVQFEKKPLNQLQRERVIARRLSRPSLGVGSIPMLKDCSSFVDAQQDKELMNSLVQEVAKSYGVSVCVITLHCYESYRFYASHGLPDSVPPPIVKHDFQFFCHHICRNLPTVVYDAAEHPSVKDDPLVRTEPHLRFYACAPLIYGHGKFLGTLSIADPTPRNGFSIQDCAPLEEKATQIVNIIKAQEG